MPLGKFPAKLTYWAPTGRNDYGASVFGAPTVIFGRWEDRAEEFQSTEGNELTSQAVVFCDRTVQSGGYLVEGDFSAEEDPRTTNALEIKQVATTRNLRYSDKEVRAYL